MTYYNFTYPKAYPFACFLFLAAGAGKGSTTSSSSSISIISMALFYKKYPGCSLFFEDKGGGAC